VPRQQPLTLDPPLSQVTSMRAQGAWAVLVVVIALVAPIAAFVPAPRAGRVTAGEILSGDDVVVATCRGEKDVG
jgi:hypothetical protein